ncbi:hypothetical protein CAEBREN_17228 [Caenorhabditis brenneri]|uniref:T-box domain-containing protein n=1 Tax=Caenorhabditis brenneri TaxID=135651 RepID=G0MBC9_CAEBE|nr:hypothetical protein CAEBREN_17228 [Caenorhabditis brenneri]
MNLDNLKVFLDPQFCFFWRYFQGNSVHEMEISEASNRVLPYLIYQVRGLDSEAKYSMSLHFELTSKRRFRCKEGEWWPYGMATEHLPKEVSHERGVLTGKDWMGGEISFQQIRIGCDFETENESEIPLHLHQKYKPVLTIQKEPTVEEPNPLVITCRLDHTEFVTVREIQNRHFRFLKRMNQEGYEGRMTLLENSVITPPILAKCTFKNSSDVSKTPSTSESGSDHPLSVNKLYLSTSMPNKNKDSNDVESFWRSWLPNFLKKNKMVTPQERQFFEAHFTQGMAPTPIAQTVVPNSFSMAQFQFPRSHYNFSSQIVSPTHPFNFGLQQSPSSFSSAFSSPFSLTGHPSPDFTNYMPQVPVVHPQFNYHKIPTPYPMTQPHRFGPYRYPFNTNSFPMAHPYVYPSKQKQSKRKSRK